MTHRFRSRVKEYPASPEVSEQWKNRRVYNKKGNVFAYVRSVFVRKGFNRPDESITWLVLRWTDKKIITTLSLRAGNLLQREDGHYQLAS